MEHTSSHLGLIIPLCAALGLMGYTVADILRVPAILFYLLIGLAIGPAGFDLIPVGELNHVLPQLVPVAAAIILFEGGLSLDLDAIRHATKPLRRLLTWGVLLNFLGASTGAHFIGGLPMGPSAIFGALMVVTGPTVITPILRRTPLVPQVRALLHWEAILIDPVGVVFAVLTLAYVLDTAGGEGMAPIGRLLVQVVGGGALGIAIGSATAWLLKRQFFQVGSPAERSNLLALCAATVSFVAGDALIEEGGIVSATVAGLVLGTHHFPMLHGIREFKEQLTTVLVAALFVLLAASVDPATVFGLGWRGAMVVAFVALVVRPIAVLASTLGSTLSMPERVTVAWIGPRGIIAAAVASLAAIELGQRGVDGGESLQGLVFATIAGTVVVQGLTARPVAAWLGVADPVSGGILLVAGPLGPDIGKALASAGVSVALVDSNEGNLKRASAHDIAVVHGSPESRVVLEDAWEEHEVEALMVMTRDPELNARVAAAGREVTDEDRVLRIDIEGVDDHLMPDDRVAFLDVLDLDTIIHDWESNDAIIRVDTVEANAALEVTPETFPMFLVRNGRAQVIVPGMRANVGDSVVVIYRPIEEVASAS